jgi:hypothetical protein
MARHWGFGMAATARIIFQPYSRGKRGALVAGVPVACRTKEEGVRRAEKAIAAGSAIGAHVVRVVNDEEAGDYGDPDYLATLGVVPEPA